MYSEDMHSAVSLADLGLHKELCAASPANLSALSPANCFVSPQICLQFDPQIAMFGCKFVVLSAIFPFCPQTCPLSSLRLRVDMVLMIVFDVLMCMSWLHVFVRSSF